MSKEPLKSLISKVGTFRGKKSHHNQRPSMTDLKYGGSGADANDDTIMFRNMTNDENMSTIHDCDLDTTVKSFTGSNNSFRFVV